MTREGASAPVVSVLSRNAPPAAPGGQTPLLGGVPGILQEDEEVAKSWCEGSHRGGIGVPDPAQRVPEQPHWGSASLGCPPHLPEVSIHQSAPKKHFSSNGNLRGRFPRADAWQAVCVGLLEDEVFGALACPRALFPREQ